MGRSLKGSKELDGASWRVSVPVQRGARKRLQASFDNETSADEWLVAQCARLNAGLTADPDLTVGAGVAAGAPTLTEAAWTWHRERYSLQHRGGADRERQIRDDLTKHLLPAFADLLDLDRVAARTRVTGWLRLMAGYPAGCDLPVTVKRSYAQGNVSGMLWVLTQVLRHAKLLGADVPMDDVGNGLEPAATAGLTAMAPKGRRKRVASLVGFTEAAEAAGRLHVIHQVTLWLLRVAGLRIGEAYGLTVGAFIDDGTWGYLLVEAQGGRQFLVRNDDEEIIATARKETTKTEAGYRLIALPHALTEMLRVVIDAFHTDAETGHVEPSARLIPPIRSADGGSHAFRTALGRAAREGAADDEALGAWIPHDLRKGYSTDLAWTPELAELVKRRAMGHRAGSDVFTSVYTLDDRLKDAMQPAAETIDAEIRSTIGHLLIPTVVRPSYGTDADPGRLAEIDATLGLAGWQLDTDGEGWVGVDEAAAILGMSPSATRRLMGTEIPAVKKERTKRGGTWIVKVDDVTAWRERLDGTFRIEDVVERTGRTYHQVYATIGRLGIIPAVDERSRAVLLDEQQVAAVVAEYVRLDRLPERSVRVAVAARLLRTSHSVIGLWLKSGRLVADEETDAAGRTFVTRASIDVELERRG